MTIDELLAIPKGVTLEEWEEILATKKQLNDKLRKLSYKIQECDDALEVLDDEVGTDRYNKWVLKRERYRKKMIKLVAESELLD